MREEVFEKVKEMLEEMNPYVEITADTKLLEEGVLDSMAIFAFVTDLEDEFGIEVPDDAVAKSNFATMEMIVSLVEGLKGE